MHSREKGPVHMKLSKREIRDRCHWGIVLLGTVMTAVTTVLRVVLTPGLRDHDTGRFTVSVAVIAAQAVTVAIMALLALRGGTHRVDVRGKGVVPLSLACLFAGVVIGVSGLWDVINYVINGVPPAPATPLVSPVTFIILLLTMLFSVVAGVTLALFGLQIAREGGTRIGMCSWRVLLPAVWLWFRLARYEMSYASAIHLDKSLYDVAMLVLELLFLFKLARFASGIGKTRPASLMVYAMATAMMAISGTLTRFCMYLLGDTQAYLASQLAGLPDLAIGVLALVFGWVLFNSRLEQRDHSSFDMRDVPSDGLLFSSESSGSQA